MSSTARGVQASVWRSRAGSVVVGGVWSARVTGWRVRVWHDLIAVAGAIVRVVIWELVPPARWAEE